MHTRLMQRSEWCGEGQDWGEFRPFRWCEMAVEARRRVSERRDEGDGAKEEERAVGGGKGQISAVQISDRYMLFGLGKHAW